MHVVGCHRAGRADEEDGVNDRLQRLPRARGGSFQFGEVVDLTIHSVCVIRLSVLWVLGNQVWEKKREKEETKARKYYLSM